jgi:hypothetical protein
MGWLVRARCVNTSVQGTGDVRYLMPVVYPVYAWRVSVFRVWDVWRMPDRGEDDGWMEREGAMFRPAPDLCARRSGQLRRLAQPSFFT